ncbi:hypothetical protein GCM10008959_20150 [Deinococcus seoulensis]|uniref:Uncharacterized protein n=2 Tax=Deinococcus TaxID=1298 RepID=A0ABQ2RV32_9DEIO|nr:hypothetical protein GCM10008959_20150 [Deinococcus seoulensis]GGS35671.1 hypothetical protein GCM10008961_29260 [Deinococcus knuensis]
MVPQAARARVRARAAGISRAFMAVLLGVPWAMGQGRAGHRNAVWVGVVAARLRCCQELPMSIVVALHADQWGA